MSEKELHPVEKTYEEHRAYIIEQRDRTDMSTPYRQEWQRMLCSLTRLTTAWRAARWKCF